MLVLIEASFGHTVSSVPFLHMDIFTAYFMGIDDFITVVIVYFLLDHSSGSPAGSEVQVTCCELLFTLDE